MSAPIHELATQEQYDVLKATPNVTVVFCFLKKGVSICDQARPITTELAKMRPQAIFAIVDSIQHPDITTRAGVIIWPTFKTFLNGDLVNNYQGGVKSGVIGNFERFWKQLDVPRKPPETFDKATVKTAKSFQVAPDPLVLPEKPKPVVVPQERPAPRMPTKIEGATVLQPKNDRAEKSVDLSGHMKYGVDPSLLVGQEYEWSLEPKLVQISSGGTHMWGLDSSGMIWRWTGRKFEQVLGQLRQVSVSADGAVWGTNFSNDVYTYSKGGWEQVNGKLKQVSVASRQIVWGVTLQNEIVFYRGDHQWEKIKISQT